MISNQNLDHAEDEGKEYGVAPWGSLSMRTMSGALFQ